MNTEYNNIVAAAAEFRVNTLYWDHVRLEPFENSLRNYPAKWIQKTIDLLKLLDAKVMVEIGSTRHETTQR